MSDLPHSHHHSTGLQVNLARPVGRLLAVAGIAGLAAAVVPASPAQAGDGRALPSDVVFQGGISVTSTTGCTIWNPNKRWFVGVYRVPVVGSSGSPDSYLIFSVGDAVESFRLIGDTFSTAFKTVESTSIGTQMDTFSASVKIAAQVPATIGLSTLRVDVTGTVQGWEHEPSCVVNFIMSGVRHLNP